MNITIETIDRVGSPQTLTLLRTKAALYGKPLANDVKIGYASDRAYLIVRDCNDVVFGIPCDMPASAKPTTNSDKTWVLPRGLNK